MRMRFPTLNMANTTAHTILPAKHQTVQSNQTPPGQSRRPAGPIGPSMIWFIALLIPLNALMMGAVHPWAFKTMEASILAYGDGMDRSHRLREALRCRLSIGSCIFR